MGKVTVIQGGKEVFDKFLAEAGDKLVVADFYADWCGPCKVIGPKVEELAEQNPDVLFIKINVDNEGEISESCEISAMPTFIFYKHGKQVYSFKGASEAILKKGITDYK